jgi:pimeloyl-ACP methyl ester carboxylesterase
MPPLTTAAAFSTTWNSTRRISRASSGCASWPWVGITRFPTWNTHLPPYFEQVTPVVIPDSGHFVPEEEAEALANALKTFLGRTPADK